jgi:hypothetical protein
MKGCREEGGIEWAGPSILEISSPQNFCEQEVVRVRPLFFHEQEFDFISAAEEDGRMTKLLIIFKFNQKILHTIIATYQKEV